MTLFTWRMIPLYTLLVISYFFWRGLSLDPQHIPSVQVGKKLPAFELPVLGNAQATLTSAALHGQVTLLNVWASWCTACTEEQVFLMKLAKQGLPIYGLNYKDSAPEAMVWLSTWGNPYRLIGDDHRGVLAMALGVYGTPETFLIDPAGVIQYRHAGPLTAAIWDAEFMPRIKLAGLSG